MTDRKLAEQVEKALAWDPSIPPPRTARDYGVKRALASRVEDAVVWG